MPTHTDGSFQQVQQAFIAQGESEQPILIVAKVGDREPLIAARSWAGIRSEIEIEAMSRRLVELGYPDAEQLRLNYGSGERGLHAFRAPHHTTPPAALVGMITARIKRLGEYQLAFNGVLFLDDVPEFNSGSLVRVADKLKLEPIGVRVVAVVYTQADKQDYVASGVRNPDPVNTQNGAWTFADLFNPVVIDTTGYPWVKSVLGKWMKGYTAPRKLFRLFDD